MSDLDLPSNIRPRVASLVRLLGSDQDGEVLAAARAIGKTLSGAGVDLHVLAASIANPPEPILIRGGSEGTRRKPAGTVAPGASGRTTDASGRRPAFTLDELGARFRPSYTNGLTR